MARAREPPCASDGSASRAESMISSWSSRLYEGVFKYSQSLFQLLFIDDKWWNPADDVVVSTAGQDEQAVAHARISHSHGLSLIRSFPSGFHEFHSGHQAQSPPITYPGVFHFGFFEALEEF